MRKIVPILTVLFSVAFASHSFAGATWEQWRGPNFDGSSTSKDLPDRLDPANNLAWSAKLPGPGAGTPIVTEKHVFVGSLDKSTKKLLGLCFDRASGKELWRKEIGLGAAMNRMNNTAAPSPISDGKHVWFYFGTGDLACFDIEGNAVWSRSITRDHGAFHFMWIYGSSPLLYDGKLYVQVVHRNQPYRAPEGEPAKSYLLALDPLTGKEIWKQDRPTNAVNESQESYATPVPFLSSDQKEILVVGGDVLTGHDSKTGKELWRAGGWNTTGEQFWRIITSPVSGGGLAFACAPKQGPVMAFKSGGEGDVTTSHLAWMTDAITTDVCVPLYYQDKLYVLNGDGEKSLSRVDPKTGKVEATVKLGGRAVFRASPTGADGKIYCMNEAGVVWVIAIDGLKILSQHDLGTESPARASVAVADGNVFIRTGDQLYCFKSAK